MTQAYPQFTPVQILEAGQRAMAEGRGEYATQFFQHLIDHYADTPEAAGARDAIARLNRGSEPPQYVNGPANGANGHTMNGQGANGLPANGHAPQPYQARPEPVYQNGAAPGVPPQRNPIAPAAPAQAMQLNVNGQTNGQPIGQVNGTNGHSSIPQPQQPVAVARHPETQRRVDPAFGQPVQTQREIAPDMPRHIARHTPQRGSEPALAPPVEAATQQLYVPAPEKNYIIGRVISGLLLIIGIVGIFGGIMLIYAAFSDPSIFGRIGLQDPAQALIFSVSVFIASLVMLIASQMATAIFDTADSTADLARLERYRVGDYDDEDEM